MPSQIAVFTARACYQPLEEAARLYQEKTGVSVQLGQCSRHCSSADAEEATGSQGGDDFLKEIADAGIYDLAIAGAEYLLDDGEVRGVIAKGKRRFIALRKSAILVPAANPAGIQALEDLARPGVRLATSVLDCLKGLWEDIAARVGLLEPIGKNVVFYANGCIAIVEVVANEKVDAALGWSAFQHPAENRIHCIPLPKHQNVSRATSIGMLATSQQPEEAQRFMDFLTAPEVRAIYRKYGWE